MEPATVGGLGRTLREMGFSEGQVGAALRAGCLSVPEAADWLLRDRPEGGPYSPRLRLFPGVSEPRTSDAFQAPRTPHLVDGTGAAELPGGVPAAPGRDGQAQARDLADRSQLIQQLKAEKRTKQRERELALQRIADDRRQNRARAATARPVPGCAQPDAIQPPGRAQCLLVIRLPSGESLRGTFPAEASLQSVQRFLRSQHPGLSPSSAFLQAAPKRRFGPADLSRSLLALGLIPGATLCVVEPASGDASPPCPAPPEPHPAEGSPYSQEPTPGTPQEGLSNRRGEVPSRDPHRWGRGEKLVSEEPMEQDPPAAARGQQARGEEPAVLPAARDDPAESGHRWPQEGHRLRREAEGSSPGPLTLAVARAAEQRHCQTPVQKESGQLESGSPAALVSPSVPSLFGLCLQGAAALLSAPSKQYRGSLASLPPGLAQVLLEYLVRGARLRPGSLRLFSGCPLWTLCLDCYPYATNRLLAELHAFPGLRQLSLFCCPLITDQGLSVVRHLSHLQQLNLSACTKLTDNCLPFLKGLLELSHLVLDQTRVTDAGLAGFLLGSPPALSHLSLNRTGVTERTLLLLPHCAPQLRELGLKQTGISDVSALRHSEALQRLFLDGTPVSEASLGNLASHPALGCLTLSGVQSVHGDRVLELISALPLTRLALPSRHTVTNVGLAAVCRLSGLLELDLTDYLHITDEGLRPLPGLCRLRSLSLANTRVTDDGLCHIRPLQLLEQLRLDRLPVSSAGVAHCVRGLPHLQVLSLASTAVGDPVARLGLTECRQLLKLNLSDTRLTDRGLRFLAQLPLVQLNVDGSGVTAAGVAELVATCPSLARIRSGRLRLLSPAEEEEPGD